MEMENVVLKEDDAISLDIKEVAQHLLKAREFMARYPGISAFIVIRVIFDPNEESGITVEDRMSGFRFVRVTITTKGATFKNVNRVKQIFLEVGLQLYEDTEWKRKYGEDTYITRLTKVDHKETWKAIEKISPPAILK